MGIQGFIYSRLINIWSISVATWLKLPESFAQKANARSQLSSLKIP